MARLTWQQFKDTVERTLREEHGDDVDLTTVEVGFIDILEGADPESIYIEVVGVFGSNLQLEISSL